MLQQQQLLLLLLLCLQLLPRSYADSKTLTEADRSKLFKALAADPHCVYAADLLSAVDISRQMLGRHKVSLNAIAETSTIGLIQAVLDAGVNLTEVGGHCCRCCCLCLRHVCLHAGPPRVGMCWNNSTSGSIVLLDKQDKWSLGLFDAPGRS